MIILKSLNDRVLTDISGKLNNKNIFSGTQRCISGKFIPKGEIPRINTCDNCVWSNETYPGSGIFTCNKI